MSVSTGRDGSGDGTRRADYRPVGTDATPSTMATLKRTLQEYSEDNLGDWAAALTYYALQALFPALIALVSIVGLVGDPASTTKALTQIVGKIAPSAAQALSGPISSLTANRTGAGIGVLVGFLAALWSASGYVGAFIRASAIIYETPEGRPIWKLRPIQLVVTLIVIILAAVVALSLVLTGPIVTAVAGPLGFSSQAVTVWNYAKWPVLLLIVIFMITVLYYAAPNVKLRGVTSVMPGAAFALVIWLVASVLFAFYVANFGSYNKTYGTMAGIVIFLIWLWITNVALLLGAEFNAERERSVELHAGVRGAEKEIQLTPRDEPKDKKTT